MKKLILILSFLSILFISSCKEKVSFEEKISQLRPTTLFYENDDFLLTAFPEKSENPQIDDGNIGNVENRILFKLQLKSKKHELCKVEFCINDKTYKANFKYQPLSSFLYCEIQVANLPTKNLYVKVSLDEKTCGISLLSHKNDLTLSYQQVIDNLIKNDEFVKEFLSNKNGELKIRFIDNGGYDYWYLGFVSAEKTTAYLIDGETGEILAIKPQK